MTRPCTDDRWWLLDTLTRVSLRHGRALHALSLIPGPLALAYLHHDPAAEDVQNVADGIANSIQAAMTELDRIEDYVTAIIDPGRARCQVCDAELGIFPHRGGWEHFRASPGTVAVFEADHEPAPRGENPPRPDWRDGDSDLTSPQQEGAA